MILFTGCSITWGDDLENRLQDRFTKSYPNIAERGISNDMMVMKTIEYIDRTPNVGAVKAVNRKFEFRVKYPNSYYVGLGSLYVPPHVHFKVCENKNVDLNNIKSKGEYHSIQIDNGIPFRTLSYPAPPSNNSRTGPMFYHCNKDKLEVRTQEDILRASGYPEENVMPDNFWGLRPGV